MEGSGHGLILSYYLPGATEENHKNLSQDSRSPGQDLNPRSPKYKAGVLNTQPQCSVLCYYKHNFTDTNPAG
jgi:hypothetical protein